MRNVSPLITERTDKASILQNFQELFTEGHLFKPWDVFLRAFDLGSSHIISFEILGNNPPYFFMTKRITNTCSTIYFRPYNAENGSFKVHLYSCHLISFHCTRVH